MRASPPRETVRPGGTLVFVAMRASEVAASVLSFGGAALAAASSNKTRASPSEKENMFIDERAL
jgi:hypothetical protein